MQASAIILNMRRRSASVLKLCFDGIAPPNTMIDKIPATQLSSIERGNNNTEDDIYKIAEVNIRFINDMHSVYINPPNMTLFDQSRLQLLLNYLI